MLAGANFTSPACKSRALHPRQCIPCAKLQFAPIQLQQLAQQVC